MQKVNRVQLDSFFLLFAMVFHSPITAQDGLASRQDAKDSKNQISIDLSTDSPVVETSQLLFPDESQMQNRNAAIFYYRAILTMASIESRIRGGDDRKDHELNSLVYTLFSQIEEKPDSKFPEIEVANLVANHQNVIAELDKASRSSFCDWQTFADNPSHLDRYAMLFPGLQESRKLGQLLSLKIRLHIHRKEWEQAFTTLQLLFKLAHDMESHRTLIGSLIGIAHANWAIDAMIDLSKHPDAPSFYWSLVKLPHPIVDMRISIREELNSIRNLGEWDLLKGPKRISNQSLEQWNRDMKAELESISEIIGMEADALQKWFIPMLVASYPNVKQHLIEGGMSEPEVDSMPSIRAFGIHLSKLVDEVQNEGTKALNLPYPDAIEQLDRFEKKTREFEKRFTFSNVLIGLSSAPVSQVLLAEIRLQGNLSALQVIQAIRLHVKSTKRLPNSLDEITRVPIPDNPRTGKPFRYELANGHAILHDESSKYPSLNRTFKFTLNAE